jgi:hypothetical protein
MSTLVAQTISNGTVSTSSANVIQGSAKAWVNFNGTGTVAIRASYNVSSITDNGTGDYTINFTNAFADASYAFACSASFTNYNDGNNFAMAVGPKPANGGVDAVQSTFIRIITIPSTNGVNDQRDSIACCVSIFR